MSSSVWPEILKIVVALLLLMLLLFQIDLSEFWEALRELTFSLAIYLVFISLVMIYVSVLKWKLFIESFGQKTSIFQLYKLYILGYFFNTFLPSFVGGDAVRSWYVGKNVGQHEAAAATILERYTGFVAMLALALVFMWFVELIHWPIKIFILLASLGLAVLSIVALSQGLLQKLGQIPKLERVVREMGKIQAALTLAKGNKPLLLKSLLLSFLFHSLTVVNTLAAAYAVGWFDAPTWELFVVLPPILLMSALPIAPNGLGVQEGAFFFFLHGIGATPEQALGVALILRAKAYLLALFGGVIWLTLQKKPS